MIGAMMMLKGKWQKPGVFNVEQFDPDPFMDELNRYGLPWEETFLWIDWRTVSHALLCGGCGRCGKTWSSWPASKRRTGCKILLALKGFSMFSVFPLMRQYLDGISASSLYEARLGREEFGSEVHTFAPRLPRATISTNCSALRPHRVQFLRPVEAVPARRLASRATAVSAASASTRAIPKCTWRSTTPAPRARGWASAGASSRPDLDGIPACIFTPVRAECRHPGARAARMSKSSSAASSPDEMGQFRRRPPHHPADYDVDLLVRLVTGFRERYPTWRSTWSRARPSR